MVQQGNVQRVHVDTILLLAHLAVPRRLLDTMHLVQVTQVKPRLVLDTMRQLVRVHRQRVHRDMVRLQQVRTLRLTVI